MAEETRIVIDMALLLLISGVCSLVFVKIRLPPILGYLTAGIILGPTILPQLWVQENTVSLLSSIGIVMLIFYIGMETDMTRMKKTGLKLIFIVCFQMPIVLAAGYLIGILLGMSFVQSIFLGAIISGTSTAVVVSVLKEAKHIDAATASAIVTITIFEDVGQVTILTLAAPLLAGNAPALGSTVNMVMGLILFIGLTIVIGVALIPRVINYIGNRYSAEILLVVSVGLCFAMASVSTTLGLSIAIGAFIMGMLISLSKYRNDMSTKVAPIKELFMAVFFISVGLQISPALIIKSFGLAIIIAAVFIVSKIASVWLGCYLAHMTARESLLIGTSLVAMGEFAFIIGKLALDAGAVTEDFYSAVIGAALITMVALPLLTKAQPRIFDALNVHLPKGLRAALARIDHVRATAMIRMHSWSPERETVRKGVFLIFVDCLVIFMVMLVFNAFGSVRGSFEDAASRLHLLSQELLMLLLVVVVSPVIHNIHYHVKTIANALTILAMQSPKYAAGNKKHIYSIFANLGNIAAFTIILALILPFIPENTFISAIGLAIVVVSAVVVAYLAWDTMRRGYDRFHTRFEGSGQAAK